MSTLSTLPYYMADAFRASMFMSALSRSGTVEFPVRLRGKSAAYRGWEYRVHQLGPRSFRCTIVAPYGQRWSAKGGTAEAARTRAVMRLRQR